MKQGFVSGLNCIKLVCQVKLRTVETLTYEQDEIIFTLYISFIILYMSIQMRQQLFSVSLSSTLKLSKYEYYQFHRALRACYLGSVDSFPGLEVGFNRLSFLFLEFVLLKC